MAVPVDRSLCLPQSEYFRSPGEDRHRAAPRRVRQRAHHARHPAGLPCGRRGTPARPAPWPADNSLLSVANRRMSVANRRMSVDHRRLSVDIAPMSVVSHPLSSADRPVDGIPIHFTRRFV